MATILERIDSKGNKTYQAKVRIKGYPTQSKTFDRKTDAKIWANKIETEIRTGLFLPETQSNQHTLAELIERYCANELNDRKSDISKIKMHLEWWKSELGPYFLNRITPVMIAEARTKLATENKLAPRRGKKAVLTNEKRSNSTVNRYMASLSIVLSMAVKEYGWLDSNPAFNVSRRKENKGRDRYLTEAEIARLLKACAKKSNELYVCVMIALATGGRYSEIRFLKWRNIDFKHDKIIFDKTKNGETRGVPISSELKAVLKNYKKVRNIKSDYLFIGADGEHVSDLRFGFYEVVKEVHFEDFHFHDLRHTAASHLAMNGASLLEIATILGHKTLQMVQRYSHLTDQHTAHILSSMNKAIFEADLTKAE